MSHDEEPATSDAGATGETGQWGVDFESLVKLLSTSLYSEASAVIRELLSNANDSLLRRRNEYGFRGQEPEIRVWLDDQAKRLIVRDNGIGMSKQDLIEYLATIGAGYRQSHRDFIGQFGIGFLSSFMVANTVTVETRKLTEREGYRWISLKKEHQHDPDYVINPISDLEIGTTVILDLKDEFRLEWNEDTIKAMVREKVGNFLFPIYWGQHGSVKLNELQAPWYVDRPFTDEDTESVRKYLVEYSPRFASAESAYEIIQIYANDVRGVIYFPSHVDFQSEWSGGMDLYCRRVFVKKDDLDILPEEFRFARGVIDSSQFPIYLARDAVFRDDLGYHAVRELIGTQIMEHFRKLANAAAHPASLTGRASAENKSEIASIRLQTALEQYHILFKHILVQKTASGRQYRFEDKFLTDFENFMPFQSSERASTSIPDYLTRMQAVGYERKLLILRPTDDYPTHRAIAQAEKREFIFVRIPVEEDYLLRYAQITDIQILSAAKELRPRLESRPVDISKHEGWQLILKFFQDRLDQQEMSLTASLNEFDPPSVAGRLLMDEDSEGMRRLKELFEAMKADPTIDKDDPMVIALDRLKQKIPYSLYINTRNPVLERLANLLQRRIDVDMDAILHNIFNDIAMASGHALLDSNVTEYHNKAYIELLAGVEARVDNQILRSKLAETQKSFEDALGEVERLKSALSSFLPPYLDIDDTTNVEWPKIEKSQLSLFAIARAELEEDDRAIVSEVYSVQVGISQSMPKGFEGGPVDVRVRNLAEPISFDVLLHTSENIELSTEWHKTLLYYPQIPDPQFVEFSFRVMAQGLCSLVIDFYHERRWLRTTRLEFDGVEQSQLAPVSSEG